MNLPALATLSLPLAYLVSAPLYAQSAPVPLWSRDVVPDLVYGVDLAPDADGGSYVAGSSTSAFGGAPVAGFAIFLQRRTSAGDVLWTTVIDGPGDDLPPRIVPDGAGGVFAAGIRTVAATGGGVATEGYLARYDANGQQAWSVVLDGVPRAMTVASSGDLVVARTSPNAPLGSSHILARFDASGAALGETVLSAAPPSLMALSALTDMAPAPGDGVYVGWWQSTSTFVGTLVMRVDASGATSWTASDNTNGFSGATLAANGSGGVLRASDRSGNVSLGELDASGQSVFSSTIGTPAFEFEPYIAEDGQGGCLLAASTLGSLSAANGGSADIFLQRYAPGGALLWSTQLPRAESEEVVAIALDARGGILVASRNFPASGVVLTRFTPPMVGTAFCGPAQANSTGASGEILAVGSALAADNDATLVASRMPAGTTGFFLGSTATGSATPPGSQGVLCLGGFIGRFNAPQQIGTSDASGTFFLELDLSAFPAPTGTTMVMPGTTWRFQAWYRDLNPSLTSNFTDAVSVQWQ